MEIEMPAAKLIVLYPKPRDVAEFERVYIGEHIPMVSAETMKGIQSASTRKIVGTADGSPPPFYRIAELTFPSMQALQQAAGGEGAAKAVAHAVSISTGGKPLFLVAEEDAAITF
jgi:uncharacterized protein (TIGR02118 family)